jgi:hypothetical protein
MNNPYLEHVERGLIGACVVFFTLLSGVILVGCYLIGWPLAILSRLWGRIPETTVVRLTPRSKTCKNCYWYEHGPRDCSCPKMVYGYKGKVDHDGVAIEDDEGWGMQPGPDFGCIHFKHKEITHA